MWATNALRTFTIQGYVLDKERMIDSSFRDKKVLKDSGKIFHKQAIEKAENEYEKFRIKR